MHLVTRTQDPITCLIKSFLTIELLGNAPVIETAFDKVVNRFLHVWMVCTDKKQECCLISILVVDKLVTKLLNLVMTIDRGCRQSCSYHLCGYKLLVMSLSQHLGDTAIPYPNIDKHNNYQNSVFQILDT